MAPFHVNDEHMFNSNDIKDFKTSLNYTYDLLVPNDTQLNPDGSVNEEKYLAELAAEVNRRYSTTRSEVLETPLISNNGPSPDYIINFTYDK